MASMFIHERFFARPLALLHKEPTGWFEGGDSLNEINVLATQDEESAKQLAR